MSANKRMAIRAATLFASLGLLASTAQPVSASPSSEWTERVAQAVATAVTAAGAGGQVASNAASNVRDALVTATAIVPRSGSDALTLVTQSGEELGIDLPEQVQDDDADVVDGTAVYGSPGASSSVAVQALTDGSLRVAVSANDASAPTQYSYEMDLPKDGGLEVLEDGTVEIVGSDGTSIGGIAAPWAVDAAGAPVPTWYTVRGDDTLVQHVAFTASSAFPVVADPRFQGDCGIFSCTVRFNRSATRAARDAGTLIGIAAGACATIGGALGIACGAGIAPAAGVLAFAAGRYYEDGNCLGIRFSKTYPVLNYIFPISVKRRTYNCR